MPGADPRKAADVKGWLARLKHDLVKLAVWRARDLIDTGAPPTGADVAALRRGVLALRDLDGNEASAETVWRQFRQEADAWIEAGAAEAAALDAFGAAVARAEQAARTAPDTAEGAGILSRAVLPLAGAFEDLSRALRS